jgi:hypothetical protein
LTVLALGLSATGVVPNTLHKRLKFVVEEEHFALTPDDGQYPKYQLRLLQYSVVGILASLNVARAALKELQCLEHAILPAGLSLLIIFDKI